MLAVPVAITAKSKLAVHHTFKEQESDKLEP
jgi:hypothetical protein